MRSNFWKIIGCFLLILFLNFEQPANAEQYAILIGIWDYHNKNLQLEAPPNDLELMASLLSAGDINSENVSILTNPNKMQIQRAFRTLSRHLKPDDSLLFYFSGHGTQILDKFGTFPGDEAKGRYPDKNDEALLPVDVNLSSPDTYLLDDELNALLQEFQTKKITCIIDTCYSGDIIKGKGEIRLGRPKGAPVTVVPPDSPPKTPLFSRTEDILDEAAEFALLLAAAPYNQVIHELRIPIRGDYLPISAMTYSLYRQAMMLPKMTYRQLLQQVQQDHQSWNLPWLPILEGCENRLDEFFLEGTSFAQRNQMLTLQTMTGHATILSENQLIFAGGEDFRLGMLHSSGVRHWAIVIGVDTYPLPFQSLKYAANDAKAVRDVFQDAGFMVTLMTPDSLLQPTKKNIVQQLERHGQLEEIDLLTVYLSGHGEDVDGNSYFLPMDVKEPLSESGLSLEELFAILNRSKAKNRFIIVDACRISPKQHFIAALSKYSEESNIIFTACDSNQWAPEVPQLQHGLFTYFLLKGLAGESEHDRGAATPDGRVTVLGLLDYVMRGIEDWYAHLPAEPGLPQQITPRVFYNGSYISLLNNQGVNPMVLNNQNISPIRRAFDEVKRAIGEGINDVKEEIGEVQEETQWQERKRYNHVPLTISFVPSLWGASGDVVTNVSFNILAGHYAKLDGVEFGSILNMEKEEARGAQFAGVANIVGGYVEGFQAAGVLNTAQGDLNGLQAAGTVNTASGNVRVGQLSGAINVAGGNLNGLQASGAANYAGKSVRGSQLASAINIARGDLEGLQASGAVNYAGGNALRAGQLAGALNIATGQRFNGVQASGAVNVANNLDGAQLSVVNVAGTVTGTQIGVVNIARQVEGLQLGVVNISESISGAPIGIVNLVKNNPPHLRFWSSDTAMANIGLRLGNRNVYSLLMVGVHPHEDSARWGFGLGIGGNVPLNKHLFLNLDAISQSIHYGKWESEFNQLSKLRLGVGWQQSRWFNIVGGVTLNVFVSDERDGSDLAYGLDHVIESDDTTVRIWPGFFLGVQF